LNRNEEQGQRLNTLFAIPDSRSAAAFFNGIDHMQSNAKGRYVHGRSDCRVKPV
jgi:hypothetical protein